MNGRLLAGTSMSAALIVAALALATAQEEPSAGLMAAGDTIYHGVGTCHFCHGDDGRGLPRLGSNLTDGEWMFGDGSLRSIEALINAGLSAEQSSHGMPMPPRAGAPLTVEQVHAVSAYVWSLSRPSS
jgi:mono/diheme cytochrome c family protein